MQHNITKNGYGYKLRPIKLEDAQFIVDTRLEDAERNKYVHAISPDVSLQEKWLKEYFERENDYYFVIENKLTGDKEGLIGINNIEGSKAEWGRWVIKKGSFAAIESVFLIYEIAFNDLNLTELYTCTIEDNETVVNFHKSINAKYRKTFINEFEINNNIYNAVEQYVDKDWYYSSVKDDLEDKSIKVFQRNLKVLLGKFEFHHIGVAANNLEKELKSYRFLGYKKEDEFKSDSNQGVGGIFITSKNQPRLELLYNLEDSNTLDFYIKNKIKMYHFAYIVEDIEKAFDIFVNKLNAKVISEMKISTYFKKRITFLMLPNMWMIELIEE